MYTSGADTFSFLLHILMGLFFAFTVKRSVAVKIGMNKHAEPVYKQYWSYALFGIIVFTFLAVFRKVGPGLGGSDALGYVQWFERSLKDTAEEHTHGLFAEPLFHYICQACRTITGNYHFFFFVTYSFIIYSYYLFIKRYAPTNFSCIPLLLMIYPFLKSFCTLRSSLAIAFIIVGLVIYKRKRIWGFVFIVASVFIHRMCLPYLFVIPYLELIGKRKWEMSRRAFLIWGIVIIIISIFSLSFLQNNYLSIIIGGVDSSYTDMGLDLDPLQSWPRFIPYIFLFLGYYLMFNKIKWDGQSRMLLNLFLFDLFLMPPAITLGIWRFNEVFYLVRMLSWGVVIYAFNKSFFRGGNAFVNLMIAMVFLAWLYIRIGHEWEELKIMPYILEIF